MVDITALARSVGLKKIDYDGQVAWEAPTSGRVLIVSDGTNLCIVGSREAIGMWDPRNEPYLLRFFAVAAVGNWPGTGDTSQEADDLRVELGGILDRCLGRRPMYTFDVPGDVRK